MTTGEEWIVDAFACEPVRLAAPEAPRRLCEAVIAALNLNVVGEPLWHQFSPGGVTGLYLLSESHLACHTWPELGTATFNLFCCRPKPRFPWKRRLREELGAGRVTVRRARRGFHAGRNALSAPGRPSHRKERP